MAGTLEVLDMEGFQVTGFTNSSRMTGTLGGSTKAVIQDADQTDTTFPYIGCAYCLDIQPGVGKIANRRTYTGSAFTTVTDDWHGIEAYILFQCTDASMPNFDTFLDFGAGKLQIGDGTTTGDYEIRILDVGGTEVSAYDTAPSDNPLTLSAWHLLRVKWKPNATTGQCKVWKKELGVDSAFSLVCESDANQDFGTGKSDNIVIQGASGSTASQPFDVSDIELSGYYVIGGVDVESECAFFSNPEFIRFSVHQDVTDGDCNHAGAAVDTAMATSWKFVGDEDTSSSNKDITTSDATLTPDASLGDQGNGNVCGTANADNGGQGDKADERGPKDHPLVASDWTAKAARACTYTFFNNFPGASDAVFWGYYDNTSTYTIYEIWAPGSRGRYTRSTIVGDSTILTAQDDTFLMGLRGTGGSGPSVSIRAGIIQCLFDVPDASGGTPYYYRRRMAQ